MAGLFLHRWRKNISKQRFATRMAVAIQKSLVQREPEKLVHSKHHLKTQGLDTDPHKLFSSRLSRLYQFSLTLRLPMTIIYSYFNPTAERGRKQIKTMGRGMPWTDHRWLFPSPGCRQTAPHSQCPQQDFARGFSFWHFMLWRSFFAC